MCCMKYNVIFVQQLIDVPDFTVIKKASDLLFY